MKSLIVLETHFGNTEQIAHAIADGLRSRGAEVVLAQPAEAPSLQPYDLVLIGSPTHSMGLPTAGTRHQARRQGGRPTASGISEWLAALPRLEGQRVGAFATVTDGFFSGSAAKVIEKQLRRLAPIFVGRKDFTVGGTAGPLLDGELQRATLWGAALAAQ
ncbi:flavodoxin family protein [Leucobacter sp. M11]|uniref:flavodoxin family protein n=1 Tax=Leucobacter sp. M11 TaxID=2993565 RepID=UPI002D8010C7|nr:flavodoxin domain-containing protein [Leucobacter sp. M11]MEB4613241.1 flavodoxin domain-containing protein [Leucobacter sp. M11]